MDGRIPTRRARSIARSGFATILAVALGVALLACRARGTDGAGSSPPAERSSPEADIDATASDSLRLELVVPQRVREGEAVPVTLRARNVSERSLELHLRGRSIAFDLIVTDALGDVVWRRLEGEVVPGILRLETLGAGQRLELEDTWDQRSNAGEAVAPGDYTMHGELLTEGEPLVTPRETLRIVSP